MVLYTRLAYQAAAHPPELALLLRRTASTDTLTCSPIPVSTITPAMPIPNASPQPKIVPLAAALLLGHVPPILLTVLIITLILTPMLPSTISPMAPAPLIQLLHNLEMAVAWSEALQAESPVVSSF